MPPSAAKQRAACRELVSTEEAYLSVLDTINTVFRTPLATWAAEGDEGNAARSGGVTRDELQVLFGSVEILLNVNHALLEQLRPNVERPAELAQTIAAWAAGPLRYYTPHVKNFPVVCALLSRLLAERPRFEAAVRVLELQPSAKGLKLQALLVSTVQRLPRCARHCVLSLCAPMPVRTWVC